MLEEYGLKGSLAVFEAEVGLDVSLFSPLFAHLQQLSMLFF